MKIILFFTLPFCKPDDEFIFDKSNGIVFRKEEPIFTFDSEVPARINILVPSPRQVFRTSLQADCADRNQGLPPMAKNFFGINGSIPDLEENLEHLARTCSEAFNIFDSMILSLVKDELVYTDDFKPELQDQPRSKPKLMRRETRRRRKREIIIATVATVAAVGMVANLGYTASVDIKSKQRDELLEQKINEDRQKLASLSTVVELLDQSIDEVAKMMRKSKQPIITYSGIELSADDKMKERMVDTDPNSLNEFFADYSQRIGRETVRAVMLLTTQRMPLFSKFILSIRANCLSIQEIEDTQLAKEFCLAFALHTTRFDTSLRFAGLGLTKFENDQKLFRIKEVILAMELKIPRLRLKATRYSVANLGYYKPDDTRWKLSVPQQLIVMPSKEVLSMSPSLCLKFSPSYACDVSTLEPSTCGESLLTSNTTRLCETKEVDSQKCGYLETHDRGFISMAKKSVVNFFHHHPSKELQKIDTFEKVKYPGAVDCGPTVIRVNAGFGKVNFTSRINYISPIKIQVTNIEEHRYQELENRTHLAIENNHNLKMSNEKLNTKVSVIEAKIVDFVHKITGWISGISSVLTLLLLALVIHRLKCCRKEPVDRIMLANFQPPTASTSRTDSEL
jgi:predicted HTH domain antitoxin